MDYMPVLSRIEEESTDGSKPVSRIYGSELLKESLAQNSTGVPEQPKAIVTKEKRRSHLVFLSLKLMKVFHNSAKTPEPLPLFAPVEKQRRSKSLEPTTSIDSNQGFKVIRKGRSEEDLDDLCSLYSEPDYNSEMVSGKIKLGIWYRTDNTTLYVRVAKGKDLASVGDGKPDPYVRMHLLPDKTKLTKRRTSIQR